MDAFARGNYAETSSAAADQIDAERDCERLSPEFSNIYARRGRPLIPPEKLLRARLLQIFHSIRGKPMLLEQLRDKLRFRWFVALGMDDSIGDVSTFIKDREWFLEGELSENFQAVVAKAGGAGVLGDGHVTVDGTPIQAWTSQKSIKPKDASGSSGGGRNVEVAFRARPRFNIRYASTTDPAARLYRKCKGTPAALAGCRVRILLASLAMCGCRIDSLHM